MSLEIISFQLGPVRTNTYLIADSKSGTAAVIDPAWDGAIILAEAIKSGWRIAHIWYTHAHFDHIAGAAAIADALNPLPLVALHPADHELWKIGGGGGAYGFNLDPGPEPTIDLHHHLILRLGENKIEVRFTPGHTPGHVVFYCSESNVCFTGDLIFSNAVGRTDLPGGSWENLKKSIINEIFTLPDLTRLLPGHGRETTVAEEKRSNPFI